MNLINKTNKRVKWNQRHEKKNKLTVTRGEGRGCNRGKKQKDHKGTCIKDPWTKTIRGRIECGR